MRRAIAVAVALLPCAVGPAAAQRLPARYGAPISWEGPRADVRALVAARAVAPATPVLAARDSGLTAVVFVSEVIGGSVGAVLGFYGGARVGGGSCDFLGSCGGEDPGLGRAILGAFVGSWLGTALGSHVGGGIAGGPTGTFGARLVAAAGGTLAAIGAAAFVDLDLDRPLTWIPLPVVAAAVTSLVVRRR